MSGVSEKAEILIAKMREQPASKQFSQEDCHGLVDVKKELELMSLLQELVQAKYLKLIQKGDELLFQAVSADDARKVANMTTDEAMIYAHIEALGREGIWTKTLKSKTNLHQHIVAKCLKNLENQRYIKSIKSVKYPTRKIYMLYNLQPSLEVTGGPWFTDSELDTEFIDTVSHIIWRFVVAKTFPKADMYDTNPLQCNYTSSSPGANMDQIMEFLNTSNVSQVELELNDVQSLCNLLVYDDKIEQIGNDDKGELYKATRQSLVEQGMMKNMNELKGLISEEEWEYLNKNRGFNLFDFRIAGSGSGSVEDEEADEQDYVYLDAFLNA